MVISIYFFYLCNVEKICKHCSELKPIGDYRDGRSKCKSCENKTRYIQKQERRKNDPDYDKELKKYDVMRKRKKEKEDPMAGMRQSLRSLNRSVARRAEEILEGKFKENTTTQEILGIDFYGFMKHMESLFKDGMNWSNRGGKHGWQIDHIIPLSSAKNMDELRKLGHHKNIQPLWAKDNRLKSNKI